MRISVGEGLACFYTQGYSESFEEFFEFTPVLRFKL